MKKYSMALFFIAPFLFAQVPSQFLNLPTDSSDYTCGGLQPCATWGMPPIPAPSSSYTDPIYGTTTWRLSNQAIPLYSRVQAWNSDQTKMLVAEPGTVYDALYDATTTPPTRINRILLSDGTILDGIDNDVLWANTDPNRIYFTSPYNSFEGLVLRYVDISTCTSSFCTLTPVAVHLFSCVTDANSPLGAGIAGNKIETGSGAQGGMFDVTDSYFAFSCDYVTGNGRNEIDVITYYRPTDTVKVQEKWYNLCPGNVPSGCKVTTSLPNGNNLFRMSLHPDGQHIAMIWQTNTTTCPAIDSKWVRSCGTEGFDINWNYLGGISAYNGHQDTGKDINGNSVWIGNCNTGTAPEYRCLQITDLNKLSPTAITGVHIMLPCSFSYIGTQGACDSGTFVQPQKQWHISMQGLQGWGLLSTMSYGAIVGGVEPGSKGWGAMELVAIKIDTNAMDFSPASFYRIGRTHGNRDTDYNCEPHATVNRDFTQILWGSSWDQDCTSDSMINGYWMHLSSPSPYNLTCSIGRSSPPTANCTIK